MAPRQERYPDAEREAIGLCIALEALDSIANWSLLDLRVIDGTSDAEVWFQTRVHQELFLVRVLDFVSERGNKSLTGVSGSCLNLLQAAGECAQLGHPDHAGQLAQSAEALCAWFGAETKLNLWIPTLELDVHLAVSRSDLLRVAANSVKHNLTRLSGVSRALVELLRANGYVVGEESIPLALDDFREHLTEDYFNYYGTRIAALTNDLRWALREYLLPVFERSYVSEVGATRYRYDYPASINDAVARDWFWRLMNHVRSGPLLPKFTTPSYLQREHLR